MSGLAIRFSILGQVPRQPSKAKRKSMEELDVPLEGNKRMDGKKSSRPPFATTGFRTGRLGTPYQHQPQAIGVLGMYIQTSKA